MTNNFIIVMHFVLWWIIMWISQLHMHTYSVLYIVYSIHIGYTYVCTSKGIYIICVWNEMFYVDN